MLLYELILLGQLSKANLLSQLEVLVLKLIATAWEALKAVTVVGSTQFLTLCTVKAPHEFQNSKFPKFLQNVPSLYPWQYTYSFQVWRTPPMGVPRLANTTKDNLHFRSQNSICIPQKSKFLHPKMCSVPRLVNPKAANQNT